MITIDLRPSKKKLIQFGWIGLLGFSILGLIIGFKFGSFGTEGNLKLPSIFLSIAILCPILSLFYPKALLPIYLILSLIAIQIVFVISNIILMLIFYIIVTPIGIFFRLIGREQLSISDRYSSKETHWIISNKENDLVSYFRQF